jgi:hypothetical protein
VFGAQVFEGEVSAPLMESIAGAEAEWVRTRILWSVAEPVNQFPPTFSWDYVDATLTPLVREGFTPIVAVYSNPTWAATTRCGRVDLAPSRFQFFMEQLAERFDGDGFRDAPGSPIVRHFQVSNEPDYSPSHGAGEADNGGCFGDDPAAYADHLRAAFLGLKAADARTVVLFAGVAHDRFHDLPGYTPPGPYHYGFVHEVLDSLHARFGGNAGYPYYDWMALHVYNDFRNAWDGVPPADQELIGKVNHFRDNQLVQPGVWDLRARPLALTEASLPSMPTDAFTNRSETLQATYPAQLVARGLATGTNALVWYSALDSSRGSCADIYDWLTFGLLRSRTMFDAAALCPVNPLPDYSVAFHLEAKPSREAYRVAAGFLTGATFDERIDLVGTGASSVEAYRFERPTGDYVLVLWADNGERIGRIGFPPASAQVRIDASVLPDWTGVLRLTTHMGQSSSFPVGGFHLLDLADEPMFVEAD